MYVGGEDDIVFLRFTLIYVTGIHCKDLPKAKKLGVPMYVVLFVKKQMPIAIPVLAFTVVTLYKVFPNFPDSLYGCVRSNCFDCEIQGAENWKITKLCLIFPTYLAITLKLFFNMTLQKSGNSNVAFHVQ